MDGSEQESNTPPERREGDVTSDEGLVVVGVGASAGGLEAIAELLQHLPAHRDIVVVVIQHLDPRHQSALAELLSGKTRMRVVSVEEETRIEGNHVYVIAPNTVLRVNAGRLIPQKRPAVSYKPIDEFLNSLAEGYGGRSIGVVLSGSATDGTLGLKRIKAEGGITFAQDQSAKFDSMPRSAIAAGTVDFVLSPRQIAEELSTIARRAGRHDGTEHLTSGDDETMDRLLVLLRRSSGVDFKQYKRPTIARRLNRRMILRKSEDLHEYLQLLQKEPEEVDALFEDLLINVTEFFRDPEVFEVAKRIAFPGIVENRKQPHTIRAWVPGCSTGEEAYSLAIALTEFLESHELSCSIQMFGTDVSEKTVETARKGIYSEAAVLNVTPERLRRFFVRTESGFQICRSIREMCIFSRHNVAKDPPLSRMDVISCRNLLIYFSPALQKRVIGTFSYALQPSGCLILGPSETLGSLSDHFSVLDEPRKLYCRKATVATQAFELVEDRPEPPPKRFVIPPPPPIERPFPGGHLQRYADQIVLSRYGPAGMMVDETLRIKSYRGPVAEYLATGEMQEDADLMEVVRPDLRVALSATIEQARRSVSMIVANSPVVGEAGRSVSVTVIPLALTGVPMHFLIVLGRNGESPGINSVELVPESGSAVRAIASEDDNERLSQELKSTREYLQSVIEELRSTNEEVQSANEELQSTNEEMQTSKEELQSSNEELNTINAELQGRNSELAQANDDLVNLLGSMNLPIVMTGRDFRIRRFTSVAEKVLRLIPTDIGRPIADLKPRINVPDLEEVLHEVLDTLQPYEREVEDNEGRSYLMRVRPYRTGDDRIDGTVLQLLDVSEIKRSLERAKHARDYAETIINTIREPLAVLDERLTVRNANRAFYDAMGAPEGAISGRPIVEVASGRFDTPPIRALFERLRKDSTELVDVEIEPKPVGDDTRTLLVNARRLRSPDGKALILVAFQDITERKREAEARYRRLFESARDGIVIVDARTGEVLDLNPYTEQLLGYRREEVVGKKLWELEALRHLPALQREIDQIRERGFIRFDQLRVATKDDREIETEVIATLYYEGNRPAIQLNVRDVGERKKFERELQETQRLESLGLLAGGIAHDFNNLLTGILGNASLALADTVSDPPLRHRLRQIVDATERAAFLTRQMLAYAGRGQFVVAAIDLGEMVREIAPLVRGSIPNGVDLKLDLEPDLPTVEADPTQIQQVLMNLVINGAEAIGEDAVGKVTVRTLRRELGPQEVTELFKSAPATAGTYVQLEVIDTGLGMDEPVKAKIFDPFFTTKFTGRGLGLAAVQGIVRRHGGVIFVHSAPGQGATFRILLPAGGRRSRQPHKTEKEGRIAAGAVALVIDDEKTVLDVAESVLTRHGMKVLTAQEGKRGVELLREHRKAVSVVILDLQMPGMGGDEVLPLLHEIKPDVPILLCSGYDENEVSRRFTGAKPKGFLQKPFSSQRLLSAVAAVLQNR